MFEAFPATQSLIDRAYQQMLRAIAAAGNITPYPRKIVHLTLNAVSNYIRKPTRAEWIAHTDFAPIIPTDAGALSRHARSFRQAAE
jgi:L-proline 4-hydroxylase